MIRFVTVWAHIADWSFFLDSSLPNWSIEWRVAAPFLFHCSTQSEVCDLLQKFLVTSGTADVWVRWNFESQCWVSEVHVFFWFSFRFFFLFFFVCLFAYLFYFFFGSSIYYPRQWPNVGLIKCYSDVCFLEWAETGIYIIPNYGTDTSSVASF